MRKISIITSLVVLFALLSCNNKEKDLQTKIEKNVKEYKEAKDVAKKNELRPIILSDIEAFNLDFSSNEKCALFLYAASEISIENMEIDKSLKYLIDLYEKYPNYEKAADVVLNIGILSDSKGDVENAKKYYNEFINKFPNHKNINVAKEALSLVGKDVDEIVRQFEEKAKDSIK